MAGAGQPWYMPLLWPVAHVTNAISKPENEKVPNNVAVAKLDLVGHLTAVFAALRSFTLAYIAIYWLYDDFDYPAFGAGTCKITVRRTHCGKIPLFVRKVNLKKTWSISILAPKTKSIFGTKVMLCTSVLFLHRK